MKLKLRRINPLQAGKMLAAFYGLFSLLVVPFVLVFMTVANLAARQAGGTGAPHLPMMLGMGMGVGFALVIPFIYAAMGFIFGALAALVYNLIAKWLGGFELEFESETPPAL